MYTVHRLCSRYLGNQRDILPSFLRTHRSLENYRTVTITYAVRRTKGKSFHMRRITGREIHTLQSDTDLKNPASFLVPFVSFGSRFFIPGTFGCFPLIHIVPGTISAALESGNKKVVAVLPVNANDANFAREPRLLVTF